MPEPLVEQQLRRLWADLFGFPAGSDQAFFDLGGTSLQALRLFDRIEQLLGVRLPATTLFSAPTIRTLAELIRNDQSGSLEQPVVTIHAGGSQPPLFLPFEQSDMLMYRHLCDALGPDQPIYGLQTTQTPLEDQGEIDNLINSITTLCPEGPYLLAGLSGSGLSAWLIAQRLKAQGHEVALLTLLDTYGPDYPRLPEPAGLLLRISVQLIRESAAFTSAYLARRVASFTRKLHRPERLDANQAHPLSAVNTHSGDGRVIDSRQDESRFAKRLAADRRYASAFVKTVSASRSWTERLVIRSALRIAQVQVRSFSLKMEFLLLIQGLMLQHCHRERIDPFSQFPARPEARSNSDPGFAETETETETDTLNQAENAPALKLFLTRYQRMYGDLLPYDSQVLYISARERAAVCLQDSGFGWDRLMPADAHWYENPGTHLTMLKPPHVKPLADLLRQEMASAIGRKPLGKRSTMS
jgi:thioesterase domain-containing protein